MLISRFLSLHLSALNVATLGYGYWDKFLLYGAYMLMPLKSRLPQLADRLIGVRIRLADGSVKIWLSDRSELIVLQEVIIDGEYGAVERNDATTIVDLGANIGISVLWFRAIHPNARIIAVEPDPKTFAKLVRNVDGDPLVRCVQAAISDTNGPVPMISYRLSWASRVSQPSESGSTLVTGVVLDDLCSELNLKQIDILKVDIEGMEWKVLPQADCLERVSEVIGEIHPDGAPDDVEVFFGVIEQRFGLRRAKEPSGRLFLLQRHTSASSSA